MTGQQFTGLQNLAEMLYATIAVIFLHHPEITTKKGNREKPVSVVKYLEMEERKKRETAELFKLLMDYGNEYPEVMTLQAIRYYTEWLEKVSPGGGVDYFFLNFGISAKWVEGLIFLMNTSESPQNVFEVNNWGQGAAA